MASTQQNKEINKLPRNLIASIYRCNSINILWCQHVLYWLGMPTLAYLFHEGSTDYPSSVTWSDMSYVHHGDYYGARGSLTLNYVFFQGFALLYFRGYKLPVSCLQISNSDTRNRIALIFALFCWQEEDWVRQDTWLAGRPGTSAGKRLTRIEHLST